MKYIRMILGMIIGIAIITIVAESIEFMIVKFSTDSTFAELQSDQQQYFKIRNQNWILIAKIGYSALAGVTGGYVCAWIAGQWKRLAISIIIVFQVVALIYGGFISELSETAPTWMWIYLLVVVPLTMWIGYRLRLRGDGG